LDAIDKIYTEHPYYGVRRMQKALESIGIKVGKRKLSRTDIVKSLLHFQKNAWR